MKVHILILLALLCSSCSRQTATVNSNQTAAPAVAMSPGETYPSKIDSLAPAGKQLIEYLAYIEGSQGDVKKTARIESLLKKLDAKYPETSQQIGDMTAGAHERIKAKDPSTSVIKIMEEMLKASEAKANITYEDAVEAYSLSRLNEVK